MFHPESGLCRGACAHNYQVPNCIQNRNFIVHSSIMVITGAEVKVPGWQAAPVEYLEGDRGGCGLVRSKVKV